MAGGAGIANGYNKSRQTLSHIGETLVIISQKEVQSKAKQRKASGEL